MKGRFEQVKNSLPTRTKRAVELAMDKGASSWLTIIIIIPTEEMDFNLNKREFRDAIKLRYDRKITDIPTICICGVSLFQCLSCYGMP